MDASEMRVWWLTGLPGLAEASQQTYRFCVGTFAYLPARHGRPLYLRTPQTPAKDAEGRPRHPEQAAWVRAALAQHGIRAHEIWWGRRFRTPQDAQRFETLLQAWGAVQEEPSPYLTGITQLESLTGERRRFVSWRAACRGG